jgi:hypothetical protein
VTGSSPCHPDHAGGPPAQPARAIVETLHELGHRVFVVVEVGVLSRHGLSYAGGLDRVLDRPPGIRHGPGQQVELRLGHLMRATPARTASSWVLSSRTTVAASASSLSRQRAIAVRTGAG